MMERICSLTAITNSERGETSLGGGGRRISRRMSGIIVSEWQEARLLRIEVLALPSS